MLVPLEVLPCSPCPHKECPTEYSNESSTVNTAFWFNLLLHFFLHEYNARKQEHHAKRRIQWGGFTESCSKLKSPQFVRWGSSQQHPHKTSWRVLHAAMHAEVTHITSGQKAGEQSFRVVKGWPLSNRAMILHSNPLAATLSLVKSWFNLCNN